MVHKSNKLLLSHLKSHKCIKPIKFSKIKYIVVSITYNTCSYHPLTLSHLITIFYLLPFPSSVSPARCHVALIRVAHVATRAVILVRVARVATRVAALSHHSHAPSCQCAGQLVTRVVTLIGCQWHGVEGAGAGAGRGEVRRNGVSMGTQRR